jgi:phosphoglycolate phosphatase-like HAD superfamily hydrolase
MKRRLVLFDIDGTLIRDHGASRDAFAAAMKEVYDHAGDLGTYDFSGRTDPQITFMVLRDAGFDDERIQDGLSALWERYLEGLEERATAEAVRMLPGVDRILDRLHGRPDVVLGLLTGNVEPGARLKLAPPRLNRFFPFGAFGSDSSDRAELPPIAVRRATEMFGGSFAPRDIVIVGDSIYDVRCGTPHSATTIAVASGKTSADLLLDEQPDHFFASLEDTEGVARAILGVSI